MEFIHLLQKKSLWNGGLKENICKKGKQGSKAEVSQITQKWCEYQWNKVL